MSTTTDAHVRDATIRVLIIDDQEMFAESISRILSGEPDVVVVGVAATMAAGLTMIAEHAPSVAIVDYQLPDGDGSEVTRRILQHHPGTRVLVLTGRTDGQTLMAAIEAGCSGFITKDRALGELVVAVRLAASGEAYVDPKMLASLLPRFNRQQRGIGSDLTRRELEVLELVADGCSNQSIAERLLVSVHTVRNHVQNVLTKLNAHSKLEAVAVANRENLLTAPNRRSRNQ